MSGIFDDPTRVFAVSLCEGARSWRNSALSPWNLALAITFAFLSVLCAIAFTLWVDATSGKPESLGRRFDFAGAFADLEKLNGTLIRDAFDWGRLP